MKSLILPANTEYVRIGDIPSLTAGAMHPIPVKSDEATEDGACIDGAWLDTVVLNDFCRRDHESALDKAIRDGTVTPLNEVSLVARHVDDGEGFCEHKEAVTLSADFKRFAESLHIEVVNSDGPPAPERVKNADEIPGKLPPHAAGKLAVKAAWEIECKTKRRASALEVMTRLQGWADKGEEPGTLIRSLPAKRAVQWLTTKAKQREYTTEACGKTLETWHKSIQ